MVIPVHAAMELEMLERMLCAHTDHRFEYVSKEPVLPPFIVCLRCGKYERIWSK